MKIKALLLSLLMVATLHGQGWPLRNGSATPATCTTGEIFVVTSSSAGSIYSCTATNTWTAYGTGGSSWNLITSVGTGTGTEVTITSGLNYNEIMVVLVGVTTGSSVNLRMQVSINAGVGWLQSSGDYKNVTNTGVESDDTVLPFHSGTSSGARTSWLIFKNFNGTTAVKLVECPIAYGAANVLNARIPTTSALNGIRVFPSSGNFNSGGTIQVYGR